MSDKLLAQNPTGLGTIGGPGLGPFGDSNFSGTGPLDALAKVISTLIGFITIVAGIYFMLQFLIGGFEWLSASGDKTRLEKAQSRLTNGVIGIVIVVAAYGIVAVIGRLLGLDIFLVNSGDLINALQLRGGTP